MGRLRWVAEAGAAARCRYPCYFDVIGQMLALLAQEFRLIDVVNGNLWVYGIGGVNKM